MTILTNEDRIIIAAGCLGILCATAVMMACKLIPHCWLHEHCPLRAKKEEEEQLKYYGGKAYAGQPLQPRIHNYNGRAFGAPQPIQNISEPTLAPFNGVVGVNKKGSWSSRPGNISTTSISGPSSAEPSPRMLSVPAFPAFTDGDECGTLECSLHYNLEDSRLLILVKGIKELPLSVYGTTNDSFVKVLVVIDQWKRWLSPKRSRINVRELDNQNSGYSFDEFRTKVVRRSVNPVYSEQFEATLSDRDKKNCTIKFMSYVCDRYSHQTLSGEADISVKKLNIEDAKSFSVPLRAIQQHVGEVLLTLTYLPTAGRLCVHVIKAAQLCLIATDTARAPKSDSINPMVRAVLLLRTKTLEKHKTAMHVNTKHPVFNETLTFDVRQDELDKITLLLTVIHKEAPNNSDSSNEERAETPPAAPPVKRSSVLPHTHSPALQHSKSSMAGSSSTGSLSRHRSTGNIMEDLEAKQGGRLTKSKSASNVRVRSIVIGRIAIGSHATGSAEMHWQEVIRNPRKQFTRWHKLRP